MSFLRKNEKNVKTIEPSDNLKRLLLAGAINQGWMHGRLEVEFESVFGKASEFYIIFKIYSEYDNSLVKVMEQGPIAIGDVIKLSGMFVSYQVDLIMTNEDEGGG
jgi:hypothetical protein